jgi:hypothetical protein
VKDIMMPYVLDTRIRKWMAWHDDSKQKLDFLKDDLRAKFSELEKAGRYDSDISDIAVLTWKIHDQALIDLKAIEWSVDDYLDMQKSMTFRIAMKIREFFRN